MKNSFNSRPTLLLLPFVFATVALNVFAGPSEQAQPTTASKPADVRAAFLKLIDRPKVDPAPKVRELPSVGELPSEHISFASDADQRVTGIIVKPAGLAMKRPVVVVLHGTGGRKESMSAMLAVFARAGFVSVAIDGRYHGERTRTGTGAAEYSEAILRAYNNGKEHPFLYDTVWDIMRLLDYLQTRPDVDGSRIGMIGFSKGGMETYLAAAVDSRISVAVPCIGVQSFRWALENEMWKHRVETFQSAVNSAAKSAGVETIDAGFVRKFYDKVMPGIYGEFDGPAMLPLIAPRPLLIINGEVDNRTPIPGLMECINAAKKAYSAARAEDRLVVNIQPKTGHAVTAQARQQAVDFLVKWLKPTL